MILDLEHIWLLLPTCGAYGDSHCTWVCQLCGWELLRYKSEEGPSNNLRYRSYYDTGDFTELSCSDLLAEKVMSS